MLIKAGKGDRIYILTTDQRINYVVLEEIKTYGIEGFDQSLRDKPLTFYPFHNIIKITKHNPAL